MLNNESKHRKNARWVENAFSRCLLCFYAKKKQCIFIVFVKLYVFMSFHKKGKIPPLWHRLSMCVVHCMSPFEAKCQRFHHFSFRGWYWVNYKRLHKSITTSFEFHNFSCIFVVVVFFVSLKISIYGIEHCSLEVVSKIQNVKCLQNFVACQAIQTALATWNSFVNI